MSDQNEDVVNIDDWSLADVSEALSKLSDKVGVLVEGAKSTRDQMAVSLGAANGLSSQKSVVPNALKCPLEASIDVLASYLGEIQMLAKAINGPMHPMYTWKGNLLSQMNEIGVPLHSISKPPKIVGVEAEQDELGHRVLKDVPGGSVDENIDDFNAGISEGQIKACL